MIGRSVAYYSMPDDGGETLHGVITRLPLEDRRAMTWRPTQDWLLEVPPALSVALAVNYVRKGVRRLDLTMRSGRLLVPAQARSAIQDALVKRPNVPTIWLRVEGVEFANARSRRAFEALN